VSNGFWALASSGMSACSALAESDGVLELESFVATKFHVATRTRMTDVLQLVDDARNPCNYAATVSHKQNNHISHSVSGGLLAKS